MQIVCLDLEGVLVPEIWVAFAEKTGVEELKRTTRDEPNYEVLMQYRLDILKENSFTLSQIQEVIDTLDPLPGALEFLNALRAEYEVILLSDTFREFASPLMRKLKNPTLFCHEHIINQDD
jgi:phosphoserine/homoserine phosphotransferase